LLIAQTISTWPFATKKAPYLAALVANSKNAMPKVAEPITTISPSPHVLTACRTPQITLLEPMVGSLPGKEPGQILSLNSTGTQRISLAHDHPRGHVPRC
jgi:hypothetical protein